MNLITKRWLAAAMVVGAAWASGLGVASASLSHGTRAPAHVVTAATTACDNGGMIGSGTVVCSPPATGG